MLGQIAGYGDGNTACVEPCTQCVLRPVILRLIRLPPCGPLSGTMLVMPALDRGTVKLNGKSELPDVRSPARTPVCAVQETWMGTVTLVAEFTVSAAVWVMSLPNVTVGGFATKFVRIPVMVTLPD